MWKRVYQIWKHFFKKNLLGNHSQERKKSRMQDSLYKITLAEVDLFIELSNIKSIRELARRKSLHPGQISKVIKSLELKLQTKLIERSLTGILLTTQGHEFLTLADKIIKFSKQFQDIRQGPFSKKSKSIISIGSPSFISSHLVANAVSKMSLDSKNIENFRIIDFSPDQLIMMGLKGAFEIAIHIGKLDWPKSWQSELLGNLEWRLLARRNHPLHQNTPLNMEKILKFPFVVPVYWTQEGLFFGNDHFPVTFSKRIKGMETATADAAITLATNTDQLVFLPEILARSHVSYKNLVELKMKGLSKVTKPIYVSIRMDSVSQLLYKKLLTHLRNVLLFES